MRYKPSLWILLFFLLFSNIPAYANSGVSNCAEAKGGGYDLTNCTSNGDLSTKYLGVIFGDVGSVLQGESLGDSNALFGELFRMFNVVVLTLGSIIVMYVGLLSTMNTAQDGSMMGKKWSSIWVPIRSIGGVSFLLPLAKGYSLLQIFVMWIVLQGVGAANQLWGVLLNFSLSGQSMISQSTSSSITIPSLDIQIKNMLNSMICMRVLNDPTSDLSGILGGQVEVYSYSTDTLYVGVPGSPNYSHVCGSATIPTPPAAMVTNQALQDILSAGLMHQTLPHLYNYFYSVSEEAVTEPSNQWMIKGSLDHAAQIYNNDLESFLSTYLQSVGGGHSELQSAAQQGWVMAGSYYHTLLSSSSTANNNPLLKVPPGTTPAQQSAPSYDKIKLFYDSYLPFANSAAKTSLSLGSSSSSASSKFSSIFMPFAIAFIQHLTEENEDPIISLQNFGSQVVMTVELTWFVTLLLLFVIAAVSYNQAWASPTGFAVSVMLKVALPMVYFILAFLWSAGFMLAVYVPLVPFIVFFFSTISWMIIVIEAIASTPILALAITAPSNDHIGRAAPGLILLAGIFLRPPLMILGFVISARVYMAIMAMLKFSMVSVLGTQISGIGLFGAIVIIVLYATIVISIAHKCFTLIYVIPDRILRWIGSAADNSGVAQEEKQLRDKSEEAGKEAGSALQGTASAVSSLDKHKESKKAAAKLKKKEGQGKTPAG